MNPFALFGIGALILLALTGGESKKEKPQPGPGKRPGPGKQPTTPPGPTPLPPGFTPGECFDAGMPEAVKLSLAQVLSVPAIPEGSTGYGMYPSQFAASAASFEAGGYPLAAACIRRHAGG